jgi:hypothetical protein
MSGPYVQLATFCDRVLQEQDGVLSIIRMVDRINVSAQGTDAPAELPDSRVKTTLVVILKSDDARGRHELKIRVNLPSGQTAEEQKLDVIFDGDERGVNLILEMEFAVIEGLYWFDVLLNEQLLTRVPLRVSYQRIPGAA